jgi:hypothetical protein
MHQVSHVGANRSEWHEPDLRRSIDFHAVLMAMAGHDLRKHLQLVLTSYGWLSARATSDPGRERIARSERRDANDGSAAPARHRTPYPSEGLAYSFGACAPWPTILRPRPGCHQVCC